MILDDRSKEGRRDSSGCQTVGKADGGGLQG